MWWGGGDFHIGRPDIVVYLVLGIPAFAVLTALAIHFIRLLNQTWLDPDWGNQENHDSERMIRLQQNLTEEPGHGSNKHEK